MSGAKTFNLRDVSARLHPPPRMGAISAANGHLELEGFNLPPARQAAVRLKGAG